MKRRIARTVVIVSGALLAAVAAATPAGAHQRPHPSSGDEPSVIATGLNNPRHVSVGPRGALYVAESGTGGDGPCITNSEQTFVCAGPTGSVTELTHGRHGWDQRRVITGLPSLAPPAGAAAGTNATGPSAVQVWGRHYAATIGLGAPPLARADDAATDQAGTTAATLPEGFGTLIEGRLATNGPRHCRPGHHRGHDARQGCDRGSWDVLADLARFEARHNPVDGPDSNPASLTTVRGGYAVADAGGNTVLEVNRHGRAALVASFEDVTVEFPPGTGGSMPMQFVPTAIVPGPHGAYFVSQLTGFPFPAGGSTIWQVTPATRHHDAKVEPYATGLTNVTDLAVARNGDLYAVQMSTTGLASPQGPTNGALVRISHRHGHEVTTVAGGLFAPYGVALSGRNAYVTTGSVLPGGGEVLQVPLG